VFVIITDADGVTTRQVEGTLIDFFRPNVVQPNPTWIVELDEADIPTADECITGIACQDATPLVATVVTCIDNETDPALGTTGLRVVVDSLINCEIGATVTLTYMDSEGVSLGTKSATIATRNDATFTYTLTSTAPFECDAFPGTASITVTCA
jgi:hypothetical protein